MSGDKAFSQRKSVAFLFFLACFLFIQTGFGASDDKLDPMLRMLHGNYLAKWKSYKAQDLEAVDPALRSLREIIAIDLTAAEPMVPVVLRVKDAGLELQMRGIKIQSRIGDIVTAKVPIAHLPMIEAMPSVVYVESSKISRPLVHDVSIPETKGTIVRQNFGLTGRGVIAGDIDTGIDWRHEDFQNADGTTRIKFLWDMSDNTGPEPADCAGCGGTVYTESQINAALRGSGGVREADRNGHGTHTAGSMAGNGRGTGNGFPAGTYAGMAVEADLIIVKGIRNDNAGFALNDQINAMAFIDNRARELGKPYAINMSLGGHFGPHDGTATNEIAVDNLVGPGKPGKVICIAAGNEGGDVIHASGAVPAGGAVEAVNFGVPDGQSVVLVDLWYSGSDSFTLVINDPRNRDLPAVRPGDGGQITLPEGTVVQVQSSNNNPQNGDKNMVVVLQNPNGPVLRGEWTYKLSRNSNGPGRFDAWIVAGRATFLDHIDGTGHVGQPGTARNAITVGSYITKIQWTDAQGNTRRYSQGTVGGKSPFSSAGPTRDGRQKPEIAAPGQAIVSSYSRDTARPAEGTLIPDGRHIVEQGTSMATPHVTGASVLLLQANPGLDANQVRSFLTQTARSDDFTGRVPNNDFGFGKMDVFGAARQVRGGGDGGTTPQSPTITSVTPESVRKGTTVELAINGTNLSGDNVSIELSPSSGVTVNQVSPTLSKITVNLTVGGNAGTGLYQVVAVVAGRRSNPGTFRIVDQDTSPDPEDPYEPNDTIAQAKPVPSGGIIQARIFPKSDLDVFSFSTPAGVPMSFRIDAQKLTPPSELDSVLGIFDSFGNLVAFNDDDGQTLDSFIQWTPTAEGIYYVVVGSYSSGEISSLTTGRYVLTIRGLVRDPRSDTTPPLFADGCVRDPNTGALIGICVPEVLRSTNELMAYWNATDPESGISKYQYAVGTTPGGSDVIPFTDTTNISVDLTNLNLRNGATYYFAVRAVNGNNLTTTRISSGTRIDTSVSTFSFYFPRVVAIAGTFTGFAVANPTLATVQVIYRLFDNNGALLSGPGISNPLALTLRPRQQLALLSTEIFGFGTGGRPGWAVLEAASPDVKAFFLYGGSGTLDGADVSGNLLTDFIFHRVQETDDLFTSISIINPNNTSANASLTLRDVNGNVVAQQSLSIGPQQRAVKLVRDLFPGVTNQVGGTIRVQSNVGLAGFQLFGPNAGDLGGINPQNSSDTTNSLFFAHMATGGGFFTEISITNPNGTPVGVRLTAHNEMGAVLAGPVTVTIPAFGQFNRTAAQAFGLGGGSLTIGYMRAEVISGSGGIFGHIAFGFGSALAGLPIQTRASRTMLFSQVAQGSGFLTGVTLVNPTDIPADVTIEVYRENGNLVGSARLSLAPGQKRAQLINEFIPTVANQLDGYIRVSSTQPLFGFELFADTGVRFLSAVPPQ
jgi:subtilisin family serine protease